MYINDFKSTREHLGTFHFLIFRACKEETPLPYHPPFGPSSLRKGFALAFETPLFKKAGSAYGWKPSHPGGNLSTRVETFPPGLKPSHPGGNLPTWVETCSPGLQRFHLVGNLPTRESIVTLRNSILYFYDSVCRSGCKCFQPGVKVSTRVWKFPPGWKGFKPGGKVSNQVERFPPGWKGFKPGGKVSTRVETNARYKLCVY